MHPHPNSFHSARKLRLGGKEYVYYSLAAAEANGLAGISRLPYSLKILLENLLRHEDSPHVKPSDIRALKSWLKQKSSKKEISFRPARVLMQDFTGVPALVDLASMREAQSALGGKTQNINPQIPVDLVIDHSVMVDKAGNKSAFRQNVTLEYERNGERYGFLRWGAHAFSNFRVVPPGTGICHQVNLEYLAQTVWTSKTKQNGKTINLAFPDTLVGTDSHTTMVNGLSVLGWGVGGIEAEAAMLGQPISMVLPDVIGVRLVGKIPEGAMATDLVLCVTERLRALGVVGKFVEYCGSGLDNLSLEDKATLANMAPEYGATCGFFPIDKQTLTYLKASGRKKSQIELVEKYAKKQGLYRTSKTPEPVFTKTIEINMSAIRPSLAGPKRPQDRVALSDMNKSQEKTLSTIPKAKRDKRYKIKGKNFTLGNGDVVIAAITSCTNTSNPGVMVGAGLLAKKAYEKGLSVPPFVKCSLAPGSQIVTDYLQKAGLQNALNKLGFHLVGYGCTTCIGNSGPLEKEISATIAKHDMNVSSVLSGNRNFEGRVSPDALSNYLASPMLVVAFALAGTTRIDMSKEPLGHDKKGNPVFLSDIWPDGKEIEALIHKNIGASMFRKRYGHVFDGDTLWRRIKTAKKPVYDWQKNSTYVQPSPFFSDISKTPQKTGTIENARILGLFGDSITTDHISPAGVIAPSSPAGKYLTANKIPIMDFNSYGARRGNHEVMMRGTFANIRIKNQMAGGKEGGYTKMAGKLLPIYDAAMAYQKKALPLVVFAGKEYGTGSSRDWAAKGTRLLGIKAVIAESFERIHRSNLVGMGVLPLQFLGGNSWKKLNLTGTEQISITGTPKAGAKLSLIIKKGSKQKKLSVLCRIDTKEEAEYYRHGGILPYVLRGLSAS